MNKKSLVLLIIGFLLLIVAFIISSYNIIKLIFLLVGIILCSIGIYVNYKNYITSILICLFLLIASYGIDTFLFYKFDKIPIFVYEVVSNNKVKVYNSLFYRIFDCNNSLILDYGYKKNYVWNKQEALSEILNGNLDNAAWNKIYKREIIGNTRFPQGRVYEDVATTYQFIYNADKIGYLSKPYYYYIKRSGSIVATGFNSKSRYDCFVGYLERLDFAEKHKLPCIEACRKQALETALATLTAFYANNENIDSDRYKNVNNFIEMQLGKKNHLRKKHEFLLWSFKNCKLLHKIYADFSSALKRI